MKNMKILIAALVLALPFFAFGQMGQMKLIRPAGEKVVIKTESFGDTLFIYREWHKYEGPIGENMACAVMNCRSDHRTYYRDRIIFFLKEGEERLVRIDSGRLEELQTINKSKVWRF